MWGRILQSGKKNTPILFFWLLRYLFSQKQNNTLKKKSFIWIGESNYWFGNTCLRLRIITKWLKAQCKLVGEKNNSRGYDPSRSTTLCYTYFHDWAVLSVWQGLIEAIYFLSTEYWWVVYRAIITMSWTMYGVCSHEVCYRHAINKCSILRLLFYLLFGR